MIDLKCSEEYISECLNRYLGSFYNKTAEYYFR